MEYKDTIFLTKTSFEMRANLPTKEPKILEECQYTVKIPTTMSLNLGMTVNIVMYDRLAKMTRSRYT